MKKFILSLFAASFVGVAWAQSTAELLGFSQHNFTFATARSAAMGGAFTSLGADAVSMNLNPAGLAMYRRSEIIITPYLNLGNTSNSYAVPLSSKLQNSPSNNEKYNKFGLGNIAGVYANGNYTIGFGFSRVADFYSNSLSTGFDEGFSITDMFAAQLAGIDKKNIGVPPGDIYRAFYDYPPVLWGAILGYQTGGVIPADGNATQYYSLLYGGDKVAPYLLSKKSGAIDEFTLSGAYNFEDKIYFGATMGFQDIRYSRWDNYQEYGEKGNKGDLDMVDYNRRLATTGSGFNFKVGVTARPVSWMRIGVSYHSPTWMSLRESYYEDMTTFNRLDNGKSYYSDTPEFLNDYNAYTPSRLLSGVSISLSNRLILSFDYHRCWYGNMGFSKSFKEYAYRPTVLSDAVDNYANIQANMDKRNGNINLNGIISNNYEATNTFSLGLEAQVLPGFFARAGALVQDSPYKNKNLKDYGRIEQGSFGIGWRNSNFNIDIAWLNSTTKQLPYQYFNLNKDNISSAGWNSATHTTDRIMMTFGLRF